MFIVSDFGVLYWTLDADSFETEPKLKEI